MAPSDAALIFAAFIAQGALIILIGFGIVGLLALPIWLVLGGLRMIVATWVGGPAASAQPVEVSAAARPRTTRVATSARRPALSAA